MNNTVYLVDTVKLQSDTVQHATAVKSENCGKW